MSHITAPTVEELYNTGVVGGEAAVAGVKKHDSRFNREPPARHLEVAPAPVPSRRDIFAFMLNPEHFAVTLARAVELARYQPNAVDQQKASLRALVGLCKLGAVRVALDGDTLTVLDKVISMGLPAVPLLVIQLRTHRIREITTDDGAQAADLLSLVRGLAESPEEVHWPQDVTVRVVTEPVAPEPQPEKQKDRRSGGDRRSGKDRRSTMTPDLDEGEPPVTQDASVKEEPSVKVEDDGIYRATEPILNLQASSGAGRVQSLDEALAALKADPFVEDVLSQLSVVALAIEKAIAKNGVKSALAAIATLVALEARAHEGTPHRAYGITLRRVLTPSVVLGAADLVLNARYKAQVGPVLARAGSDAASVLIRKIDQASDEHETQSYVDAVCGALDGPELLLPLLHHKHWYVVEGGARLLGEIEAAGVVPELAVAMEHKHPRVRAAAAGALAKIGTPAAAKHLRQVLASDDDTLRAAVVQSVGGRTSGAFIQPVLDLAEAKGLKPDVRWECYRALGRIGTPEALHALAQVTEPGKRLLGWKSTDRRIAAIEGLALAGGAPVIKRLEELASDRDKAVSEAARKALQRMATRNSS